jgi:hypothetical protein
MTGVISDEQAPSDCLLIAFDCRLALLIEPMRPSGWLGLSMRLLSVLRRLDFLDLVDSFERALRDYSVGTMGLGVEFVRPSDALTLSASNTAVANTSATASTAAPMVVTGATTSTAEATRLSNTADDLFLRGASALVYKLIIEGSHLHAVVERYRSDIGECERACGVIFANTVETERGHLLAKSLLHAAFSHAHSFPLSATVPLGLEARTMEFINVQKAS